MPIRTTQANDGDGDVGAAETAGGMDKFAGLMRLARVSGNTTVSEFGPFILESNSCCVFTFCVAHSRSWNVQTST